MPTDTVWIVVKIPKKDYEKEKLNISTNLLNLNNEVKITSDDLKKLDFPLEKILEDALKELGVNDAVWVPSKNGKYYQVYFPCDLDDNDSTLSYLQLKGIGVKPGTSVGYIPFTLFYDEEGKDDEELLDFFGMPNEINNNQLELQKKFKEKKNDFFKSVTSRLTVAQVVEGIKSGSDVTFDFLTYNFFAGWIAANGLLNNSPVDIAAAMMIEPIMATVMAITFSLVIEDRSLFLHGLKGLVVSLSMCLLFGFCYGMIVFIWPTNWQPPEGFFPTSEMSSRGGFRGLWYGACQGSAAGGAVAVTLLHDNYCSLVGAAVASTFLPPFINTGLLWAMAVHIQIRGNFEEIVPINISGTVVFLKPAWAPMPGYHPAYMMDMRKEAALLGCVSMLLTIVNVVGMIIFSYIVLRIKEVSSFSKLHKDSQRFFQDDIKAVRKYNRKSVSGKGRLSLGDQILKEWATITGIDHTQLLSNKPEAKITQLQTLQDIISDVETDNVYQTVIKNSVGRPTKQNLLRRLTQPILSDITPNEAFLNHNNNWNAENELSGRRYTISPVRDMLNRRNSRMNNIESPILNISSNIQPNYDRALSSYEMDNMYRRRNSALLRRTLQESEHSPYSIWPSNFRRPTLSARPNTPPSSANASMRRRRLSTHHE